MSYFKTGDKVRCTQPNSALTEGEVYTVDYVDADDFVHLEGKDQGFFSWRFEKVEVPAAASKFKVGDKVRRVECPGLCMSALVGATATVTEPVHFSYGYGPYLGVEWDRNGLDKGQSDGGYNYQAFEVVPAVTAEKFVVVEDRVYATDCIATLDSLVDAETYVKNAGVDGFQYHIAKVVKTLEVTRTIKEI